MQKMSPIYCSHFGNGSNELSQPTEKPVFQKHNYISTSAIKVEENHRMQFTKSSPEHVNRNGEDRGKKIMKKNAHVLK